jgi:hypothetical protein
MNSIAVTGWSSAKFVASGFCVRDVEEADATDRDDCAELLPAVRRLAPAGGELLARGDDGFAVAGLGAPL